MRLENAYQRLKKIIGDDIESLTSVRLVEQYRRYWKPETVKIILLAESHVFTSDADRDIKVHVPQLPDSPTQYARFVYCLGYGEKSLTMNPLHPKDGTPDYWKIFYSCNHHLLQLNDFSPILHKTKDDNLRVANKIKLLQNLKAKGIWLVDTSIVALYKNGAKMPELSSVLKESWESYTREVVDLPPEN